MKNEKRSIMIDSYPVFWIRIVYYYCIVLYCIGIDCLTVNEIEFASKQTGKKWRKPVTLKVIQNNKLYCHYYNGYIGACDCNNDCIANEIHTHTQNDVMYLVFRFPFWKKSCWRPSSFVIVYDDKDGEMK